MLDTAFSGLMLTFAFRIRLCNTFTTVDPVDHFDAFRIRPFSLLLCNKRRLNKRSNLF